MTNMEIYQQNIPQDSPTTEGELTEADQGSLLRDAPSQSGPAPSQSGPAPSQSVPAPSQSVPAPSQSVPAPSQSGPAPRRSVVNFSSINTSSLKLRLVFGLKLNTFQ
uniref:Uncharacterized protein n=1 Tax=Cyprinodon variegatus TaxID=28743 RepID=A0A3Q2DYU1_CYPVA